MTLAPPPPARRVPGLVPVDAAIEPTAEDCLALRTELRLNPIQGAIGTSINGFHVLIFAKGKRPSITEFRGWPIHYAIGGGMPRAGAA